MHNVQIVTDSSAHFTHPQIVGQYAITIVPNLITIAGRTYREGVDLSPDEAMRLLAHQTQAPVVQAPTEADFHAVFARLSRISQTIVSVHPSREMSPSWHRARNAAAQVAGQTKIAVIDSRSLSAGQAMLVRLAARAAEELDTLDDIERAVRGAAERIYATFYVENMNEFLTDNALISESHAILGGMLGVKPLFAIEDGHLRPMEKVRTRLQAVERLVEFAVEFTEIEDAVILQPKAHVTEATRMLQDRLALEFPGRHFPHAIYGPSLAALIGTDATGLVILEREYNEDDDFDDE